MRTRVFLFTLLLATAASAQHKFELKDASKYFDIRVTVASCEDGACSGKASFEFLKKGGTRPYQVISLPDTYVELEENGGPLVNVSLLYDKQSVINVDDFNFDGMEDVAICDGNNGSYGGPSYRIYLSSRSAGKFVYSPPLTKLGQHLGMFTVDKRNKTIETFDKSGCCWHITERYTVVNNQPVKIFEEVEDATIADEKKVKVTTKTRVNGRWKTAVKYVKREQ